MLDDEVAKEYFADLMQFVADERVRMAGEVYPAETDMFAAFHLTGFDDVKVVLLGQDPYPNPRHAVGLSFSVPAAVGATGRLPLSLKNIYAAMRTEGLSPVRGGDLTSWAKQGVLLLNAALTFPKGGKSAPHLPAWLPFTANVLARLVQRKRPVVFIGWGVKAQKLLNRIPVPADRLVTAPHPAARREWQLEFRSAGTFRKVNSLLKGLGEEQIDWETA